MKIKFIPILVFILALSLVLSSYITGAANNLGIDCTGSEGSGGTQLTDGGAGYSGCNNNNGCHNATSSINTTVELDSAGIAVTGYHPQGVYTVKISATNTGSSTWPKFGFQLATVFAANAGTSSAIQAGTWGTLPLHVQSTAGGASGSGLNIPIIEQSTQIVATTGTGGNGTTYVESIPWTAPATGSGAVTIYGVMNAVNGNNVQGGDGYQTAIPVTIQEDTAVHTNVGINEIPGQLNSFNVYPTLMNDNVTVAFDLKDPATVSITLISMQGQTVKTFMTESLASGAVKKSFDVKGLASGIYFVRMQIGNASVVSKVVKD